jgi:hypothetical protein
VEETEEVAADGVREAAAGLLTALSAAKTVTFRVNARRAAATDASNVRRRDTNPLTVPRAVAAAAAVVADAAISVDVAAADGEVVAAEDGADMAAIRRRRTRGSRSAMTSLVCSSNFVAMYPPPPPRIISGIHSVKLQYNTHGLWLLSFDVTSRYRIYYERCVAAF